MATVGRAFVVLLALASTAPTVVADPGGRGFTACLAVRDGAAPRIVDAEHADRLVVPASVAKMVTVAGALEALGPDHRVRTEIRLLGQKQGRVLDGDLVVVAGGDPTWSARFADGGWDPLGDLARQTAQHLQRVRGDLVVDTSRFAGRPFPASRAVSEVAFGYGAPVSALAVDENLVRLRIAPGARADDPVSARWLRDDVPAVLVNLMRTAPRERHERGTVDVLPSWDDRTLVLRGEYPVSEPAYTLPVALHDGDRWAALALRRELARAGVTIDGAIRVVDRPVTPPDALVVATVQSPPLRRWLAPILTESENWLAEMLLRVVAAETQGVGRTADGAEHLVTLLEERAGIEPGSLWLEDGSGLSPYDLVTPEAIVQLLRWARRRPWGATFFGALATPGRGTLAAWPGPPQGLPAGTRAKTGTLRNSLALAGVVETPGTPPLVFACFLGNRPDERPGLRRELAARILTASRRP